MCQFKSLCGFKSLCRFESLCRFKSLCLLKLFCRLKSLRLYLVAYKTSLLCCFLIAKQINMQFSQTQKHVLSRKLQTSQKIPSLLPLFEGPTKWQRAYDSQIVRVCSVGIIPSPPTTTTPTTTPSPNSVSLTGQTLPEEMVQSSSIRSPPLATTPPLRDHNSPILKNKSILHLMSDHLMNVTQRQTDHERPFFTQEPVPRARPIPSMQDIRWIVINQLLIQTKWRNVVYVGQ